VKRGMLIVVEYGSFDGPLMYFSIGEKGGTVHTFDLVVVLLDCEQVVFLAGFFLKSRN
jgi:hypothetical protein